MSSWVKRVVIIGIAAVVLFFGAILVYVNFINDPADELDTNDLAAVFDGSTTPALESVETIVTDPPTTPPETASPTVATESVATPVSLAGAAGAASAAGDTSAAGDSTAATETIASTATTGASDAAAGTLDGTWVIDPAQSTMGYRVEEVLSGINTTATGRGNDIDGSITISGTTVSEGSFTIQVDSITSDESMRDGQFRGRIMETDEFPTATFTLTEPLEFAAVPASDEQITATATGDLTLHGVTNPVTFDVTAQTDGSTIGVLGTIPVVFADYGIDNPSGGPAQTEDNGLLEFILVFVPA